MQNFHKSTTFEFVNYRSEKVKKLNSDFYMETNVRGMLFIKYWRGPTKVIAIDH